MPRGHLGSGRGDAAVAVDESGSIVGYALVCTDERSASRAAARAVVPLARMLVTEARRGRLDRRSTAFYRDRMRDGARLARGHRRPPATMHAHLNVASHRRSGSAALALVAHVDGVCRRNGHAAWYGEINERAGRRAAALERLGMTVVRRDPNHTLTRLLGEPVERLTIVRCPDDGHGSIGGRETGGTRRCHPSSASSSMT